MAPHLVRWDTELRAKGLVVLDVDHGGIDEKDVLARYVKDKKKTYPVLWDEDGKTADLYGVKAMPTAYLIGPDGKVLWNGHPMAAQAEALQKKILAALEKVDLAALKKKGSVHLATPPGKMPKVGGSAKNTD